ncbi:phosphonate metabolism protein PhnM [Thermocrinis sp.]
MKKFVINNAKVVLPDRVIERGYVVVEEGVIADVGEGKTLSNFEKIDAKGQYLLPGFIDLHSDAIEKEIEPRPNTLFPMDMAILEIDKKLASCGITTIFHSISFAEGELGLRSIRGAYELTERINHLKPKLLINTMVHLRYEISNVEGLEYIKELINSGKANLVSFMDHTPGQGQFKEVVAYKDYLKKTYRIAEEQAEKLISKKLTVKDYVLENVEYLIGLCRDMGVPTASHDDDRKEKVIWMKERGVSICEFPTSMEAVETASRLGMNVCLGSPNILRGKSHSKNLSARELLSMGYGNIICSDYYPPSLLHSVFLLEKLGILELHKAVNLATSNPAKAVGLSHRKGSIEVGKDADLILVDLSEGISRITKTMVKGRIVYCSNNL